MSTRTWSSTCIILLMTQSMPSQTFTLNIIIMPNKQKTHQLVMPCFWLSKYRNLIIKNNIKLFKKSSDSRGNVHDGCNKEHVKDCMLCSTLLRLADKNKIQKCNDFSWMRSHALFTKINDFGSKRRSHSNNAWTWTKNENRKNVVLLCFANFQINHLCLCIN